MTTYFSSDLHVGHKKIMEYCPRSRALAEGNLDRMEKLVIDGLRSRVTSEDTLYLLGDITFTAKVHKVEELLMQLPGKEVHLILGNHDQIIRDNRKLHRYFTSISQYKEIKVGNDRIILMHYPIESWNHMPHGAWHLHGHMHSRNDHLNEDIHRGVLQKFDRRFDVGIDSRTDFMPWSWEEIREFTLNREASSRFVTNMNQGV